MRIILSVALVLMLTGCGPQNNWSPMCSQAADPSLEAETLAGMRAVEAFEPRYGGVFPDAEASARMAQVGARLAAASPELSGDYCYQLLDADNPNAASLPVGAAHRLYITRGLYSQLSTDALLAGVLAHEMAHLVTRDSFKPRCSTQAESLDREMLADTRGAKYLRAADYDPRALIEIMALIEDVQPRGWSEARVRNLTAPVIPDRLALNAGHAHAGQSRQ